MCNFFLLYVFQQQETTNIADESEEVKDIEETQSEKLVSVLLTLKCKLQLLSFLAFWNLNH